MLAHVQAPTHKRGQITFNMPISKGQYSTMLFWGKRDTRNNNSHVPSRQPRGRAASHRYHEHP